jgi:putative transposase
MQELFKVSVRRSCGLALLRRSVWYAKSQVRDQSALRQRIRDIAMMSTKIRTLARIW